MSLGCSSSSGGQDKVGGRKLEVQSNVGGNPNTSGKRKKGARLTIVVAVEMTAGKIH